MLGFQDFEGDQKMFTCRTNVTACKIKPRSDMPEVKRRLDTHSGLILPLQGFRAVLHAVMVTHCNYNVYKVVLETETEELNG